MRLIDYFIPKLLLLSLSLFVLMFSSCDCAQEAKGIVLDRVTRKPIDSVYIHKYGKEYGEYSDSTGAFRLTAIDGGLLGCPVLNIAFVKNGYLGFSKEYNSNDTSIIYLEPEIQSK